MEPIHAVIFDLDGLIIDSETVGFRVWKELCREQGFELTDAIYHLTVGRGVSGCLEILATQFGAGFSKERARQSRPAVWRTVLERDGVERKPGFDELLELLEQRNIMRAIATSTERPLVNLRLAAARLEPSRFHAVVCGDEVAEVKPAPDIYLRAAELLGVSRVNSIALEDSTAGVSAAHAAEIRVLVIPDLLPPTEDTLRKSLAVFPSLREVRQWLEAQLSL